MLLEGAARARCALVRPSSRFLEEEGQSQGFCPIQGFRGSARKMDPTAASVWTLVFWGLNASLSLGTGGVSVNMRTSFPHQAGCRRRRRSGTEWQGHGRG